MQDMKTQDVKMTDQVARHEIAGCKNEGPLEIVGREIAVHEISGCKNARCEIARYLDAGHKIETLQCVSSAGHTRPTATVNNKTVVSTCAELRFAMRGEADAPILEIVRAQTRWCNLTTNTCNTEE